MLTRQILHDILDMRDEAGVLSVYLTAQPWEPAATRPAWQVRTDRGLAAVGRDAEGDPARAAALAQRLAQVRPDLDQVLDPGTSGRGRALFTTLGTGITRTVTVQAEFPDEVTLAPVPRVVPLLAAWSLGAPAGVVVASGEGLRLVDLRFGIAAEAGRLAYADESDRRMLVGPGADVPGLGQRGAAQRDLYTARNRQRLELFLRDSAPAVAAKARAAGWEEAVVAGDAELAATIGDALAAGGLTVSALPSVLTHLSSEEIGRAAAEALAAARRSAAARDAARARGLALAGGRGAFGLADVLSALAEGRVEHLLLDAARRWHGRRAPDGRLVPGSEVPPGVAEADLADEPCLADRMALAAYAADARVTAVADLDELAAGDGVAALLRW